MKKFTLIDGYILRKFLTTFFAAIGLLSVLIIVIDLSERIGDLLDKKAPVLDIIFKYYINFVPSFINDYSPLFVFISVIFFTSKLASNTEIIAILSSGISFKRMLRPYIYGAIIVSVLSFGLGNFLIPYLSINKLDFERKYIRKKYYNTNQNLHIQMDKTFQIYVKYFDNNANIAYDFSYEKFGKKEITEKFMAQSITFDSITKKWTARTYFKRTIDSLNETLTRGDSLLLDSLTFTPDDLNIDRKNVVTMNLFELSKFIDTEQARGSYKVAEYKVLNYQRIINPFTVIIMTFIAVAVSFRKKRGGIGFDLALGLLIAFSFVIMIRFTTMFSIKGNLPPLLSVLIPPIIYSIMAYILIKKAPK